MRWLLSLVVARYLCRGKTIACVQRIEPLTMIKHLEYFAGVLLWYMTAAEVAEMAG